MDREIPEEHARMLIAATGADANGEYAPEVPANLAGKYWELRRCFDRLSQPIGTEHLAMLAFTEGHGRPNVKESEPESVVDLFKRGELAIDDEITVKWRYKPHAARFKGIDGQGKILAEWDGDERAIDPKNVSVHQHAAV